jgi:hypothetical protein
MLNETILIMTVLVALPILYGIYELSSNNDGEYHYYNKNILVIIGIICTASIIFSMFLSERSTSTSTPVNKITKQFVDYYRANPITLDNNLYD